MYGNQAFQNKNDHTLFEPIQRGQIKNQLDWDNMEMIWEHIFKELGVEPRNINLLMTDSPFSENVDK